MSAPDRAARGGSVLRTGAFVLSLATVVLAGVLVPMPLVSSAPGGTQDVGALVSIDADTTELNGEAGLLTVQVDQPSLVDTVVALFDGDRALRRRDRVIPDRVDHRDYLRMQQREFQRSFRVAAAVGLRAAGFDTTLRTAPQVVGVITGGPADGHLRIGDVIRAFEGVTVSSTDELVEEARGVRAGEELTLRVERDGQPVIVTMVAGDVPGLAHPGMGITLHTLEEDIVLPFDVELIDQQDIGGPSAGMMAALTIYDRVAEEDLLAGRHVVGTGTVDGDGTVGPVGSIREKAHAAVASGADLMLVPATQARKAAAAADGRIEVLGVSTVAEAIHALRGGR